MIRRVSAARALSVITLLLPGCFGFSDLMGGDSGASDLDASTDASVGVDGSSDSATPNDGAVVDSATFCTLHETATFCADFDESTDAAAGFSTTYLTDGGVVLLDDSIFQSPPASLLSGSSALEAGAQTHGCVTRATGVTPLSSETVDFDLRWDELPPSAAPIEALALVFDSATRSSIQFNLSTSTSTAGEEIVALDGGKSFFAHSYGVTGTVGNWVHVTIALALAVNRSITVTVGGTVVVDHATMNPSFVTGPAEIYVGNAYEPGPSSGAVVHYDNVVLQAN